MKLTAKQQKFVNEYVKSGNATQSAIKAGYSKRTAAMAGSENLRKPYMKDAIDKRMQKMEDAKIAKAEEVLQLYSRILRGEESEKSAVATPKGVEVVETPADLKTRLSAGKELMKRYPAMDPMTAEQIRKLKADADLTELKAKREADGDVQDNIIMNFNRTDGRNTDDNSN
ncbi:terminase small subunit [Ligilactobacillus acidipiscis]|uniref:Phage terminase, small subunit n=1 Tax=Ligilactobacillus acidipiscis TaxID=89059 RepID=A0A1K1KNU1_9LACO|nr:terminase small subunit [Ligilactobacillus acidipiscis]SFV40553.1 Phage terminase, small subunit [Ligilactobacillus acidipiscis]